MIVSSAVKMKNKMSGLLMEVGAVYDKKRLHGKKYFGALLERVEDVPDSVKELLKMSRNGFELFDIQKKLVAALRNNRLIRERVKRLMSIPGIGELTNRIYPIFFPEFCIVRTSSISNRDIIR